jgi:hypothetical protein
VSDNDDRSADQMEITLRVDEREHRLRVDPRTTLLDALRERLVKGVQNSDSRFIPRLDALLPS